jgi:hypothetical protein
MKKGVSRMKNTYLVRFMTAEYQTDSLIITSNTPEDATTLVSGLKGVLQVFDVWVMVLDLENTNEPTPL